MHTIQDQPFASQLGSELHSCWKRGSSTLTQLEGSSDSDTGVKGSCWMPWTGR